VLRSPETIRLEVRDERGQNQDLAFRFTDKFVGGIAGGRPLVRT